MEATGSSVVGEIFGVRLHDVPTIERLRRVCEGFLNGERASRIFTPNPEILLRAHEDRSYADLLNSADLALPDGTGVALIGSLRSRSRIRRWPGVEIAEVLLQLAARRGETAVFFGGRAGVTERAAERWRACTPPVPIEVVGSGSAIGQDGRAPGAEDDADLVARIRALSPAILLVGLGAPKQERWIAHHTADLPSVRVVMGVGGAFDMWTGERRRAPTVLRRVGLEWAWRLALEPGRWQRILRATVVFPFRALTDRAA